MTMSNQNSTGAVHDRRMPTGVSQRGGGAVAARVAAFGVIGILVVVAGFIVGADIGGNRFTSFSIGGLHGYEATAWVGAAVGGILVGVMTLWLARPRRTG
jgi:predicted metalloprotease